MKVTLEKNLLLTGLRRVLTVVSPRTTLPVLNNVLLEARDGVLILTTTDLEVCMTTEVAADVGEPGMTTLPAKKFAQIAGALPDGQVVLETDANQSTSLSCERSFFRIVGLDAKEFPRDTEFTEEWGFTVLQKELSGSLSKVSYARSVDETRHVLNGVLLSLRGSVLTIVGTDGRRLALVEKPLSGEALPDGDVILPAKVVVELEKILVADGEVVVKLSEARASFSIPGTRLTSKLVEGTYPNYRQVIPASFSRSVGIPREQFATVLNRVGMVVSGTSANVILALENAIMHVSASSSEFGEAKEPLEVSYEGEPLEISFNPAYFSDPLRHLNCDQLIMQFNDEYSPVSLSGDEGFLYVVMPMRS